MKFLGVQFGTEKKGKTNEVLLSEAKDFVAQGEYAMAVGRFREALRSARPEDMPKVHQSFMGMWNGIESHAIRTMGQTGSGEVSEFMTEGTLAIDNLKLVQECANTFGLNGLFMDDASLKRVVDDRVLKELQVTLTPTVTGSEKKKKV